MSFYVVFKENSYFPRGAVLQGSPDEGLRRCNLKRTGKNNYSAQASSLIAIDFRNLSDYIIHLGTGKPGYEDQARIDGFQAATADIVLPILKERQEKLDPSYKESWKVDPSLPKSMNEVIANESSDND